MLIATNNARGGSTGNRVRYVLLISLVIVVIGMLVVSIGIPGGLQDGPTTVPGPR